MEVNYNMLLVALSYVVSVFGAFTSLQLAIRIPGASEGKLWGWLIAAAFAMGGGAIWSMHFIAMLAYEMPMQVAYDPVKTLLSMLIAVVVVGVGLFVVGRGDGSVLRLIGGGIFAGLGVAGMHYMGMDAMRMPADLSYKPALVGLSVLIAIVAAIVALWLAFNLRGNLQRFGSALVMGAAVCGMHYTGMAAAIITPNGESIATTRTLASNDLALYIFAISTVLLTIALVVALRSRQEEQVVFEI